MNKRYDNPNVLYVTIPAGGFVAGNFYRIGAIFGQAVSDGLAGNIGVLDCAGIWDLEVEAVDSAIAQGTQIYYEAGRADALFSNEATANSILVGVALGGIAAGEVEFIDVAIRPMPLTTAAEAVEDAGGADA